MSLDAQDERTQAPPAAKLMRIPAGLIRDVLTLLLKEEDRKTVLRPFPADPEAPLQYARPLYSSQVAAGFPSPASDHQESSLDLHRHLVKRPESTFFVRAAGDSMIGAHIRDGDLLIVDRSLAPQQGKIVIAALDGELTVKHLKKVGGELFLEPANPKFPLIRISGNREFAVLGTVTAVVHRI